MLLKDKVKASYLILTRADAEISGVAKTVAKQVLQLMNHATVYW